MKRVYLLIFKATLICLLLSLYSCIGVPAVHKHLTDKIYLTAPDLIEQLSVSYHYSGASYTNLVNQTVFEVGFNSDFVIAKQHPSDFGKPINKDTTLYYIIEISKIKTERKQFVSRTDTIKYRSLYTDQYGNDSLGHEQTQISTLKYSPNAAEPLTYEEYIRKRKELQIPDDLKFTIAYKELK